MFYFTLDHWLSRETEVCGKTNGDIWQLCTVQKRQVGDEYSSLPISQLLLPFCDNGNGLDISVLS